VINHFLLGALAALATVAALLFLRYWYVSRDRLFLFFSLAFVVFAIDWTELAFDEPALETRHFRFFIRLVGFVLIVMGIIDKNRRRKKHDSA